MVTCSSPRRVASSSMPLSVKYTLGGYRVQGRGLRRRADDVGPIWGWETVAGVCRHRGYAARDPADVAGSLAAVSSAQRPKARSISSACSTACFFDEPVAGDAAALRATTRHGRVSPRSQRSSWSHWAMSGHAPWLRGSSWTQTSSAPGYLEAASTHLLLGDRVELLDADDGRRGVAALLALGVELVHDLAAGEEHARDVLGDALVVGEDRLEAALR